MLLTELLLEVAERLDLLADEGDKTCAKGMASDIRTETEIIRGIVKEIREEIKAHNHNIEQFMNGKTLMTPELFKKQFPLSYSFILSILSENGIKIDQYDSMDMILYMYLTSLDSARLAPRLYHP